MVGTAVFKHYADLEAELPTGDEDAGHVTAFFDISFYTAFVGLLQHGGPLYWKVHWVQTGARKELISKEVYDAFWQKRRVIEATNPRTDPHLTKTRIRAMAAADLEFQNRGLGGYKPWCRSDGVAGIQRILD